MTGSVASAACEMRRRSAPRYALTARAVSGAVTKRQASPSRWRRRPLPPRASSSDTSACSISRARAPVARASSATVTGFSATKRTASMAARSSSIRAYLPLPHGDLAEQIGLLQVDEAAPEQVEDRQESDDRVPERRPLDEKRSERHLAAHGEELLDLLRAILHAVALAGRHDLLFACGAREREDLLPRGREGRHVPAARRQLDRSAFAVERAPTFVQPGPKGGRVLADDLVLQQARPQL